MTTTTKNHHFLPSGFFPKSNQYSVLVIDDMPVNRVLLSKILCGAGYKVVEADSGEQGLEMIKSGHITPDVIVTDVEMPEMDGITFTEMVRNLPGRIGRVPVIVASGNPDPDMELDAYDAGADVFLCKPFNLRELREEVADAIKLEQSFRLPKSRLSGNINELRTRLSP